MFLESYKGRSPEIGDQPVFPPKKLPIPALPNPEHALENILRD